MPQRQYPCISSLNLYNLSCSPLLPFSHPVANYLFLFLCRARGRKTKRKVKPDALLPKGNKIAEIPDYGTTRCPLLHKLCLPTPTFPEASPLPPSPSTTAKPDFEEIKDKQKSKFLTEFNLLEVIGEGAFGEVHRCEQVRISHNLSFDPLS